MERRTRKIVLVVDDNADHRTIAAALLSYAGYDAIQAPDATTAARMVDTYRPDLLVVDIDLPDKNGLAWVTELRANAATSEIAVLMYTAFRDVYNPEMRALGITSIDKAEPPQRFLDRVAQVIGEQH